MGLQWKGHREQVNLKQGFLRGCRTKTKQNETDSQEFISYINELSGNVYCTENYIVCYFLAITLVFCFKKLVNKRKI